MDELLEPLSIDFTKAFTSSLSILDLEPVPLTSIRFTPSSLANFLIEGLACAFEKESSSILGNPFNADTFD